jgi:hypothetical protein
MGLAHRLLGTALAVGALGALVGVAVVAPQVLRAARPALREGLKRGLAAYGAVRAAAAEFAEDVEDLIAEVQQELSAASERPANDDPPPEAKQA